MNTYGTMEVLLLPFLTSALDGGEWSASRFSRFASGQRVPGIHRIGGCVGPKIVLDAVAKEKKSLPRPCRESNLCRPSRSYIEIYKTKILK
jgi:hypothetical protein